MSSNGATCVVDDVAIGYSEPSSRFRFLTTRPERVVIWLSFGEGDALEVSWRDEWKMCSVAAKNFDVVGMRGPLTSSDVGYSASRSEVEVDKYSVGSACVTYAR